MGAADYFAPSNKAMLRFRCVDGCELIGVQTRSNTVAFRGRRYERNRQNAEIAIPLTASAKNFAA